MEGVVVGEAVVVEVITLKTCSPVDLAILVAVDAIVVAAVVKAPKTFPECLKVCFRMTSIITKTRFCYYTS